MFQIEVKKHHKDAHWTREEGVNSELQQNQKIQKKKQSEFKNNWNEKYIRWNQH